MRCALVLILLAGSVAAEPMSTSLDELVKETRTVVIAKLVRGETKSYTLTVERALLGTVKPGPLVVKPSRHGGAHLDGDTRFVAFVSGSGEWLAYAKLLAGPSLERGVLHLAGFYDENAHLIDPGVITLAQLEALVTKGMRPRWRFRGKLFLATPRGVGPSSIEIEATVPGSTVTGVTVAGMPAPGVHVGSWRDISVKVTWPPSGGRAFELDGVATGLHADGTIAVEYRMRRPDILSETDLRAYLADAKRAQPIYVFEVEHGTTKIPLVLGEQLGHTGRLGTAEITRVRVGAREVSITAGTTTLKLGSTLHDGISDVIAELMAGPVTCTLDAKPCTVRYVTTRFAARF